MIDHNPFPRPDASSIASRGAFLYFVWEREAVRLARQNGHPAPWTNDPILAQYKFTNIRRRDDRVSAWIIDNIIDPNDRHPDLWFHLTIARLVNWPPTLRLLLDAGVLPCEADEFDFELFVEVVDGAMKKGKAYGGAYMIYPTQLSPGKSKSRNIADHILAGVIQNGEFVRYAIKTGSVEGVVKVLSSCYGLSTFMAGQVAADLTYCPPLNRAHDLYSFAPIGPGSQKGLNIINGYKLSHAWKQDEFNRELMSLREEIGTELQIVDLTLHDVQNIACEFSKYASHYTGENARRTIFKPETLF